MTLFGQFSEVVLPESTYSSLSGSSLLLDLAFSFKKFPSFWERYFAHLSELINFNSPSNHQKTVGFLLISGGIKVNYCMFLSCHVRVSE